MKNMVNNIELQNAMDTIYRVRQQNPRQNKRGYSAVP